MDNHTTVIIADNSEEFTSLLTEHLKRADGFQVIGTANDGEQAIRLITERKPKILVLDLMLPKKDGLSVLKAISGMQQKPVVLATSAFITDYVTTAVANLGVQYLMLRPCDMSALVERLEEIRGGDLVDDTGNHGFNALLSHAGTCGGDLPAVAAPDLLQPFHQCLHITGLQH